jgi:hypothetical protein
MRTIMIDTYVGRTQMMLRRSATALALTMVAACSRETLLEVETPDQIRPGDAANPAGAQALRAAAIGNFSNFYGGTINVGANLYGGLVSDELINARPGGDHIDQRAFNENTFPNLAWNNFGQAYTQLIRARRSLAQYAPAGATRSTQIGQLHALSSLSLSIAGELFCNGVPLSDADDTAPQFTTVSNAEMFTRAVSQSDSALATLGSTAADVPFRNVARIAKARALIDLARFADAAAAVGAGGDGAGSAAVPTSFVANAEYSATTLVNTIYDWMVGTANFGPSEREGGNGLNFISAADPRVPISATIRLGQDGSTRVNTILGYPNGSAPTRLATGVEARLIEAEAALKAGNAAGMMTALNTARADAGARTAWAIVTTGADPLPPLVDPGTEAGRIDLLFRERAFWLYLTTHRVGDLRRLVRQYTRPATSVWPTGAYFKGGTYGTDQNITPSFAERNNANWEGCTDRNP